MFSGTLPLISGCSGEFYAPAWQYPDSGIVYCAGKRGTVDLSAAATFHDATGTERGIEVYVGGQFIELEGTSASAPESEVIQHCAAR